MVYQGVTYAIKDGYTNYRYVYWLKSSPDQLVVSDTYPPLGDSDCLVFLNKGGTHLTVPGSTVLDGDLLVPGSILASALSANCVTADAIAAGAVTANALAANSVGANAIAAGAVTADKIISGAITADKIAAHSITANQLAVGTITAGSGIIASIDASKITTGTISADRIDTTSLKAQRIYSTTSSYYAQIGERARNVGNEQGDSYQLSFTGISLFNNDTIEGGLYAAEDSNIELGSMQHYITLLPGDDDECNITLTTTGTAKYVSIDCVSDLSTGSTVSNSYIHIGSNTTHYGEGISLCSTDGNGGHASSVDILPNGINLLGTVTGIAEHGSNANGEYWKFGDGLLICYGEASTTVASTSGITVNFPVEFIDIGTVNRGNYTMVANVISGFNKPTAWCDNVALGYSNIWIYDNGESTAGRAMTLTWLAVGRWK